MKESVISPTSPLAPFPPLPPPEFRSRAPEFYGFVAWTSTYLGFVVFLLWALLPDELIVSMGITWYPNREWALLLPAYSVVVFLLAYFVYSALAIYGAPAFNEMRAITDSRAHFPFTDALQQRSPYARFAKPDSIPELYDLPIGLVNRVIYRNKQTLQQQQPDEPGLSSRDA